jgi:uncharacterized membrane protein YphA (DoxX/SURF4 family)
MAHQPGTHKLAGPARAQATALMIIRITLGIYLLFLGIGKARWLLDSTPLANQLALWSAHATPVSRWYLERVTPGAPVFARLVPLGEMLGGLALIVGFWTRMTAGALLLMILNFHVAAGAVFSYGFLRDATGLPILGSLLGLMLAGGRLPLSIRK